MLWNLDTSRGLMWLLKWLIIAALLSAAFCSDRQRPNPYPNAEKMILP